MAQEGREKYRDASRGIRIIYGDSVTVLPMTAADAAVRASGTDCKILMCLSADSAARTGSEDALLAFAERIDCTPEEVERAIAYWRGAGVIEYVSQAAEPKKRTGRPKKQTPEEIVEEELKKRGTPLPSVHQESERREEPPKAPEKKMRRADELPNYTIEELSKLIEERKNLSLFLDECQRAYGKMFNPRDVSKVLGMIDYLSLSEEYVLTLLRYFGEMPEAERKSLHYIEKMAFSLSDDGVTDTAALCEYLERLKMLKQNEGQIRTIFGMGSRAFTAKEKSAVLLWLGEYRSDMELIRLAYEKTVHATGKPSLLYAAKILERWYREGLTSVEAVQASEQKETLPSGGENFETNDFFEAAIRRSYGEAYEKAYKDPKTDSGDTSNG